MNLLTTILTALQPFSWITPNSWACLQRVVRDYMDTGPIIFQSKSGFNQPITINGTVYMTTEALRPHPSQVYSNILIYEHMSQWVEYQIYGNVVILSESLDDIDILWEKHRVVNLIVILQESNLTSVIFSWFPYNKNTCHDPISLRVIDIWEKGKFLIGNDLFPQKIPVNFKGCPVKFTSVVCPPFTQDGRCGPEDLVVNDLFQTLNLSFDFYPVPHAFWYYDLFLPNGTVNGIYKLLADGLVDLGGGCLFMIYKGMGGNDFLPSHMAEQLVWFLPPNILTSNGEGLYIGFEPMAWILTIAAIALTCLVCMASMPKTARSDCIVWTFSRLLGIPCLCRNVGWALEAYGTLFELSIMIITTLYKSTLLLNLTFPRMTGFGGPYDGILAGLVLQYRPNFRHLLNQSHHSYWNILLAPERSTEIFLFDFDLITKERKAMALALKHADRAHLRGISAISHYTSFESIIFEYPIVFQKLDQTLLLRKYHPLTKIFEVHMARLIEAGLPDLYLKRSSYGMISEGKKSEHGNSATELKQLRPAFYLMWIFLSICLSVFAMEVIHSKIHLYCSNLRNTHLNSTRRNDVAVSFMSRLRMMITNVIVRDFKRDCLGTVINSKHEPIA